MLLANPMEKQNLVMQKCPRFQFCNAPKCPLDIYVSKRRELSEDDRCPIFIQHRRKSEMGKSFGQIKKAILELKRMNTSSLGGVMRAPE